MATNGIKVKAPAPKKKAATGLGEAVGPDGGALVKAVDEGINNQEQMPPGKQFLKALGEMHDAYKDMLAAAEPMQENPDVKAFIGKMVAMHDKMCEAHKACLTKAYPDAEPEETPEEEIEDKADDPTFDEEQLEAEKEEALPEEEDEEMLKASGRLSDGTGANNRKEENAMYARMRDDGEIKSLSAEEEELKLKALTKRLFQLTGERV